MKEFFLISLKLNFYKRPNLYQKESLMSKLVCADRRREEIALTLEMTICC
jgi:hypothetical protein